MNMGVQISVWVPAFNSFGYMLDHLVNPFLIFWGTIILFSTGAIPFYIPTSNAQEFWILHILANIYLLFSFIVAFLMGMKWYFIVVLICISLVIDDIKHLFMWLWPFVYLLWRNVYSNPLPIFKLDHLLFCCWVVKSSLYILDINRLSDIWFVNIFSHSVGCLFTLLIVSFDTEKFWILTRSNLFIFLLWSVFWCHT